VLFESERSCFQPPRPQFGASVPAAAKEQARGQRLMFAALNSIEPVDHLSGSTPSAGKNGPWPANPYCEDPRWLGARVRLASTSAIIWRTDSAVADFLDTVSVARCGDSDVMTPAEAMPIPSAAKRDRPRRALAPYATHRHYACRR